MVYFKNFDKWIKVKKKLDFRSIKPPYFKEGDIWWASFGVNIGMEVDGKGSKFLRPVLILRKFSQFMFIGIPLTRTLKENSIHHLSIIVKGNRVSALVTQIRAFSYKRLEDKLEEISPEHLKAVRNDLQEKIFSPSLTRRSRGLPQ